MNACMMVMIADIDWNGKSGGYKNERKNSYNIIRQNVKKSKEGHKRSVDEIKKCVYWNRLE